MYWLTTAWLKPLQKNHLGHERDLSQKDVLKFLAKRDGYLDFFEEVPEQNYVKIK